MKGAPGIHLAIDGRVTLTNENSLEGDQTSKIRGAGQDRGVGYEVLSGKSGAVLTLRVLLRSSILQVGESGVKCNTGQL